GQQCFVALARPFVDNASALGKRVGLFQRLGARVVTFSRAPSERGECLVAFRGAVGERRPRVVAGSSDFVAEPGGAIAAAECVLERGLGFVPLAIAFGEALLQFTYLGPRLVERGERRIAAAGQLVDRLRGPRQPLVEIGAVAL